MTEVQGDGERTKSNPRQSRKRLRISLFDEHEHNGLASEEHNAAAAEDDQEEHTRDDEDRQNEDADADDEPVQEQPRDTEHHQPSKSIFKDSAEHRSVTLILSDPDVLDCPICFDPLSIPVYQCDNGHIACTACCLNLENKCASCLLPVGLNRCKAFEKVLESIKIPCPYVQYGCNETLSYSEKNNHELECIYIPCSCPHKYCDFVASSKDLSSHFNREHNSGEVFLYDNPFDVTLNSNDEAIILQEDTDGNLFIIHNLVVGLGNAVNISCIGPHCMPRHHYEILARSQGCSLELKSFTKNIQRSSVATLSSRFLLIPSDYFGANEPRNLGVCIGQMNRRS